MEEEPQQIELVRVFKALSDSTRYQIVQLLLERHHCSRSLSLALGISESAVSQHMVVLKECGIVYGVRHRHHIHYLVDQKVLGEVIGGLTGWLVECNDVMDCHGGNPCRFKNEQGICK